VQPSESGTTAELGVFGVKSREQRRNVMIKARMCAGASWCDALILNLSTRGMLVRADRSPGRGSYLEIRRGPHVIVARVIWSNHGRFGVQTQDPVPADSLIQDPDGAAAPPKPGAAVFHDRRAALRPTAVRHESSRQRARVAEFAAIALVCGLVAILIGGAVAELVATPLSAAQAALASNQ
jgi:hypothetical protein